MVILYNSQSSQYCKFRKSVIKEKFSVSVFVENKNTKNGYGYSTNRNTSFDTISEICFIFC